MRRPRHGVLEVPFRGNASGATLELPLFYYRGYQARLATADGQSRVLPVRPSAQHLAAVVLPDDVPAGTVTVRYRGTGLRRLAAWLSLATLAALAAATAWRRRRRRPATAARPAAASAS